MIFVNLQFLVKCSIRRFWPNHNHPWAKRVGKSGRQRGATPTTPRETFAFTFCQALKDIVTNKFALEIICREFSQI